FISPRMDLCYRDLHFGGALFGAGAFIEDVVILGRMPGEDRNVKRVAKGNLAVGDAGSAEATRWYLASVATFMIPAGVQMVLVPYLLAIELNQPAARYGLTQMAGQLPMLLFRLF